MPTPMTVKDLSKRMHQLEIEFPDEHMRKYWEDNNPELTKAEADHHILGMYNSYYKRIGWHYTRKHENPEQFPIEKHWIWYEGDDVWKRIRDEPL